jgi:hypothetical protein
MPNLPYLATPGSIKNALDRIKTAATPDRVTGDFVTTKLQMKGGTGAAIPPFLKKIGFVASDGTPTDLYKRFRNQSTAGPAVADAIRIGYKTLAEANEYFYDLSDKDLLALIVQVTGAEADSAVAKQTLATLRNLKSYADFETKANAETPAAPSPNDATRHAAPQREVERRGGLNLSYTINLNLPATTDQAVFNAIFRSLREHLLSDE